jgi:predicted nucleic acid-binding protein
VTGLADPASGNRIHVSRIAGVEVVSAVTRRALGGSISPSDAAAAIALFRYHFTHNYAVAEVSSDLILSAMHVAETHGLRGYDSVQLAAALEVRADCVALGVPGPILISADVELNTAAIAEGLAIDDPNLHP